MQDEANPYTVMQLNDAGIMQSYALTPGFAVGSDANGLLASLSAGNAEINTLVGIDTETTIQDQINAISAPSFSDISSGTNTTASMIVGTGASISASGSGTIHSTTADTLQTARSIGGVSFDGSANIVPQTIQTVDEASDTTCFPLIANSSGSQTSGQQPKTNTSLTFNASTGRIS